MVLELVGLFFALLSVLCFGRVLMHAFGRSLGTGFMVLCIPFYGLYYGVQQFEHVRKGWLLAGWMGGFVLGVGFRAMGLAQGA